MQLNEEQAVQCPESLDSRRTVLVPIVRTRDLAGSLEVILELPGAAREDIEIVHEGRRLAVRARVAEWTCPTGLRPVQQEIQEGDYEVTLELPRSVAGATIDAELRAGLLTLSLPKAAPECKTIPVREA